jgi:nitroreductase
MNPQHISYVPNRVPVDQALPILHREYELANSRRSVRFFSDAPVSREVIEHLIKIAGTAPSGANLQPWHFVAIDDPAIKKQIREAAEQAEKDFYEHRAPAEWLKALEPLGTDWRKPFLETAPWLIVVFRRRWLAVDGQVQKTYYSSESVGIAVGMLIAAVHRSGLATLTHTPAPMSFLRRICRRPENESPFVILPIGYPAAEATVPDINRKPLHAIMQHNTPP